MSKPSETESIWGMPCPNCKNKTSRVTVQSNKEGGGWYTSMKCGACEEVIYDDFPITSITFHVTILPFVKIQDVDKAKSYIKDVIEADSTWEVLEVNVEAKP